MLLHFVRRFTTIVPPKEDLMAIKRLFFDEHEPGCMYHPKPGCMHVMRKASAKFVGSLTDMSKNLHAPALDIDFPTTVETGADGKTRIHIVGPKPTNRNLRRLLEVLVSTKLMSEAEAERNAPTRRTKHRRSLPSLVLDAAARANSSSTPGHFHLYIEREMPWVAYEQLLIALCDAEIVGRDFCDMCLKWHASFLLKPEYKKSDFKLKFEASA